jgi:hypothetical protein
MVSTQDLAETDLQKELLLGMTKGQYDLEQVSRTRIPEWSFAPRG